MIELIAIEIKPHHWIITTTDLLDKYPNITGISATMPIPEKEIQKWMAMRLKKESGSE